MYFVAIESLNDGEVNHLVGPFEGEVGEVWMQDFVKRLPEYADAVYILHAVSTDAPELVEFYEEGFMNKRNWIVNVATADNDPLIFGPYTEARAEALATDFNKKIDPSEFDGGYIQATAYPIRNLRITAMLEEFGQ